MRSASVDMVCRRASAFEFGSLSGAGLYPGANWPLRLEGEDAINVGEVGFEERETRVKLRNPVTVSSEFVAVTLLSLCSGCWTTWLPAVPKMCGSIRAETLDLDLRSPPGPDGSTVSPQADVPEMSGADRADTVDLDFPP